LRIIDIDDYRYIIDSYLQTYVNWQDTASGANFNKLLGYARQSEF
jgi:hypothetical protein